MAPIAEPPEVPHAWMLLHLQRLGSLLLTRPGFFPKAQRGIPYLISLSFASGCTDVLTFLKLGNVFTSAMTGNTALLAIEIGRSDTAGASRALTALLAFTLGVALAARINTPPQGRAEAQLRQRCLPPE